MRQQPPTELVALPLQKISCCSALCSTCTVPVHLHRSGLLVRLVSVGLIVQNGHQNVQVCFQLERPNERAYPQPTLQVQKAQVAEQLPSPSPTTNAGRQVFLDIAVEGEPIGRIVIELFDDAKIGAQRFLDLSKGVDGVGYRLSKFDSVTPEWFRNEGVKRLAYGADGRSPIAGGYSVEALEAELEASPYRHDRAGLVSLVVKEAEERPIKERLVAMRGKLVTIKEQAGEGPNGTAFVITRGPVPSLDATNLIVGRVVGSAETLENIAAVKVAPNLVDSPFFKAGKAAGDKRAVVAEKAFNKPLFRVQIARGGVVGAPAGQTASASS